MSSDRVHHRLYVLCWLFSPPFFSGVSGATQSAATASPLAGSTAGLTAPRSGLSHAEAVEAELAELTRVNAQLRGEVAAKSAVWREERESLEAQARSAREAAAGEMDAATAIRRELAARPTMEEVRSLRQQLRVLQQLEFNAGDEEDEVCVCVCVSVCVFIKIAQNGATRPLHPSRLSVLALILLALFTIFILIKYY